MHSNRENATISKSVLSLTLELVISSCVQSGLTVASCILEHSHVDLTVGWHGEPHVLRVCVNGALSPSEHVDIFLVTLEPVLCEDLDVLPRSFVSFATVNSCIHQHILHFGRYDTGNDIGERFRVSQVGATNPSQGYRNPGLPSCRCWVTPTGT